MGENDIIAPMKTEKKALIVAAACAAFVALGDAPAPAEGAPRESIMFIGAHPDDSEGFAGLAFLLKDKYDLHVVDFTRGEFGLGKAGFLDGSTGRIRTEEEKAACAFLGATPHFVGQKNSGPYDSMAYADSNAVARICELLAEIKPKAVFTHWPVDSHPDHVMTAAATYVALRRMKCRAEFYYYEVLLCQTRAWTPLYSVDISSVIDKKAEMLRKYACQNKNDELAQTKIKQAEKRGAERNPPVKYAETYTTFNGKPMPNGILANLPETVVVSPAAEVPAAK